MRRRITEGQIAPYADRPAETDGSSIAKSYDGYRMIWDHASGFSAIEHDGWGVPFRKTDPTPERIARFKADVQVRARTDRSVEAFLSDNRLFLKDSRIAGEGRKSLPPGWDGPLPRRIVKRGPAPEEGARKRRLAR